MKKLLENIFSIKKEGKYRVLRICWISIKFKRKNYDYLDENGCFMHTHFLKHNHPNEFASFQYEMPYVMIRNPGDLPNPQITEFVDICRFIDYLNTRHADVTFSVLDVGARNGLISDGLNYLINLKNKYLVGIEPDVAEASRILENPCMGQYNEILPIALYSQEGEAILNVTQTPGCSSILAPNVELFESNGIAVADWFKVKETLKVKTTTLEKAFPSSGFDIVKIDTQGVEYDVLSGASDLFFAQNIAISLETQFYEFYKGQKLIGDIFDFLTKKGYWLLKIDPNNESRDGLDWECDLKFIKAPTTIDNAEMLLKHCLFAMMCHRKSYVAFLLRNYGYNYLGGNEFAYLTKLLNLKYTDEGYKLPVIDSI